MEKWEKYKLSYNLFSLDLNFRHKFFHRKINVVAHVETRSKIVTSKFIVFIVMIGYDFRNWSGAGQYGLGDFRW